VAYASREIEASTAEVFAILVDPTTYPSWLAGASEIRDIDDDWPSIGSRFHHRVGLRPLTLADNSEVLAVEPNRLLRLAVRVRPLISAVVTFTLRHRCGVPPADFGSDCPPHDRTQVARMS